MDSNNPRSLWTPENIKLGKLLLAVSDMQFFNHDNWTSAPVRHSQMPTSTPHFTRPQMNHSSMLAVHARPQPEDNENEPDVSVLIRRKKLSNAWEMMQSCDPDLWTDVCSLHSMIKAVEQDEKKFDGIEYVLKEVAEAKMLMNIAEILTAVESIEAFRQEEWSNEAASSCIRRGSMVVAHEEHHGETTVEAKVRHAEHAEAWQRMKSCSISEWTAACRYHEECTKRMIARREKLEAAVWVIQDYNSSKWTSENVLHHPLPSSMRHAASLATRVDASEDDEEQQAHKKKLIDAWQTMKEASLTEWTKACKSHEDIFMKEGSFPTSSGCSNLRTQPQVRNGVGGIAA